MFAALSAKLQAVFDRLGGRGRLTPENVDEALREVRLALLEADVNFKVVRAFIDRVRATALGREVLSSVTPAQAVVKVVHDELVELLGGAGGHRLAESPHPPTVIMLVGLQGSGKTTTAAKLARLEVRQGHHPLLAAADVYRPAAIEQLRVLGGQLGVPVVGDAARRPVDIALAARDEAAGRGLSPVIVDTAGRLHVDEAMLEELRLLRAAVKPHHVLLVVDAMTGQDAVTVAERFNEAVGIDAVVLTKLDGDARGGAALSVRHATGRPIAFAGVGEKVDALEPFHPERVASRILGMGDVVTLVERAQDAIGRETAEALARRLRANTFTLDDFRTQLGQVRRMGPLDQVLGMLPFGKRLGGAAKELDAGEAELGRFEAVIGSMTPDERREPETINGSRRLRIARGSGTTVQDVNRLLKQFAEAKRLMKQLRGLEGRAARMKHLPGLPAQRG